MLEPFAVRTHEDMKPVLLYPDASGPKIHYYMIRGGVDKKNITVWETGLVENEYIKTYGHYHIGKISETYWILQGEGIVLLQKRKIDLKENPVDDQIEWLKAIKVKAGDKVFMEEGIGHLICNIGKTWLVTADDSPVNFEEKDPISLPGHADYTPVTKLHGFAYYVVSQNGQPTLIKNQNYKFVPASEIQSPS